MKGGVCKFRKKKEYVEIDPVVKTHKKVQVKDPINTPYRKESTRMDNDFPTLRR